MWANNTLRIPKREGSVDRKSENIFWRRQFTWRSSENNFSSVEERRQHVTYRPSRENEHEQMFFVSLLPGPPPPRSLRHTHTPAPLCPLKLLSLQRAALGLRHRHVDVISIYSPWSTPMLNGRVTKGEHKVTSLDFVEHSLKGRSWYCVRVRLSSQSTLVRIWATFWPSSKEDICL